jgi:hypothetical protein
MGDVKIYIGTKIIAGEEMSEGDFLHHHRGQELDLDKSDRPGYKVTYQDGYISWSPVDAFINAYRLLSPGEWELAMGINQNKEAMNLEYDKEPPAEPLDKEKAETDAG